MRQPGVVRRPQPGRVRRGQVPAHQAQDPGEHQRPVHPDEERGDQRAQVEPWAGAVAQAQAPAASTAAQASALRTQWGEPDLQGIWTDETDTPLQRPSRYAGQEFFTATQRAELDAARAAVLGRDARAQRATEDDVASGYNSAFWSWKRVGIRTSLITDPADGRMPPLTPEAQKIGAAEREFRLALLQGTNTCRNKSAACSGGKYDPTPSPRRAELPPRFHTGGMNRSDGSEDSSLAERCLTGGLPDFGAGIGSFPGSCRRQAASRSSMTWVRAKGGNATS